MTWPKLTAVRTKDSGTRRFAITNHAPSPFSIKEAWVLTWVGRLFGTVVQHLLSLPALWIKSLLFAPTTPLSIYRPILWWAVWTRTWKQKGLCGTCRRWPSAPLSIAATSADDMVCQNQQRISSHPYWGKLWSSVGLPDFEQQVVWPRLPAKHVSVLPVWCPTDVQGAWLLGEVTVTFSVHSIGHSCFSLAQDSSIPRPLSSNTTQLSDAWPRRMSNDPLLWIRGCLR